MRPFHLVFILSASQIKDIQMGQKIKGTPARHLSQMWRPPALERCRPKWESVVKGYETLQRFTVHSLLHSRVRSDVMQCGIYSAFVKLIICALH